MSTSSSTPSKKLDTRYSTPEPELDDHRPRQLASSLKSPVIPSLEKERPQKSPMVPTLEVQQPTPAPALEVPDLLHVDSALHGLGDPPSVTRDFYEHAVDDGDKSGDESDVAVAGGRHADGKMRRLTNRAGRPQYVGRHDRSRDTSSSRSTSPANSVEAFAEPRRRQRANTIASRTSSVPDFHRTRTYSSGEGQRRPTLGSISIPKALTARTDRDVNEDITFDDDDEPGKTYRIDFEELEEFVALSAQGKIPNEDAHRKDGESSDSSPMIFGDVRPQADHDALPNVMLNGENFYEKPVISQSTNELQYLEKRTTTTTTSDFKQKPAERFTFFSSDIQKPLNATKLGDFVADGTTTFRDLFDVGPESGVWWLDVLNPTKAELETLGKAFKIHRLTREDIETQEAREKVELFAQYYFVCFRSFNMHEHSEDFLDPIHLYIVVCQDGVLSFSYTDNPHAHNVRKRIAKLGDFLSLGPDYICYAMIDDIVDSFAPIIRDAERESENIEDQVFIAREDDLSALLKQIGDCRKRVLNMMRLLGGKADVIKGFAKRCNEQYDITPRGDIGLYLGDIQDHVVTMMSNLGHVEKMLSRSHANYLAQLNVDNILKGNSTNKALAKITVVATILVPLNLVTGLFGMNVAVPGKDSESLAWFFGIIGTIFCFICVMLLVARKLKAI